MAENNQHDCESIAVIGMACRLPGQIDSPAGFWDLMMGERRPQSLKVPSNRFNIDAFYHSNNERPGSLNVPGGYFLQGDPTDFDPTFFGVSPIEAMWMDPQQRKLLEVAYEAFESSGTPLHKVSETLTGCFVGSFTSDFQQMSFKEHDFRHTYSATGVDPGILANRITHVFNLQGPSAVINTACSSSLTALHMACSAIRNHDCEAALVGGSNLILTIDQHINTAKLGILSPTSQCHTFDESADGYARAEGVGALYIKSLATALKDGDPVRAVIRSTAINSNGKVQDVGISHPSVQGQCSVIRAAYEKAGLDFSRTAYVECHGTGTPVGDPIELQAIFQAIVGKSRAPLPLLVGSVKPNIGHSEASSSISTIIKAVLAIENGVIPPTAGIANLNARIPWKEWYLQPVTEPKEFPVGLPSRRVGVNAFGYGGTNSHAVLENHQPVDQLLRSYKSVQKAKVPDAVSNTPARPQVLVFSAHDVTTIIRNIKAYSEMKNKVDLIDLAYTLSECRSIFAVRAFAICHQDSINSNVLDSLRTIRESLKPPTIGFAFTGQGAQWPRMGSLLFDAFPFFTHTIQELDQELAKLKDPPSWTIEGCLLESDSSCSVDEPERSQPLCTAIQIGLVTLLAKWNVVPVVTVGHSSGEIAAAFTAGYLSAEDAIRIAYYRGKVVASASVKGEMLAVGLGAEEVSVYLENYQGSVVIGCHNSPKSVTLSGNADAVEELRQQLETKEIFARKLRTGGKAYHSHHMVLAASEYKVLLKDAEICSVVIPRNEWRCRMMSTVSNRFVDDERMDSAYWAANLESPVFFNQAIHTLTEEVPDLDMIVEIGPHSALSGPIRQIFAQMDKPLSYMPTLKRDHNDIDQLLTLAGELWTRNSPIAMSAVTRVERSLATGKVEEVSGSLLVDLPPYQWNYAKKYLSEPRQSREHRACKHPRHDTLGRRLHGLSPSEPQWRNILRLEDVPWLKHHTLGNEVVFPAAGYFAMAIEAITQMNTDSVVPAEIYSFTLRNVSIKTALVVPDNDNGVETLFSLRCHKNGPAPPAKNLSQQLYTFSVSSIAVQGDIWNEHATGMIGFNMSTRAQSPRQGPSLPLQSSGKSWYQSLLQVGFNYGPTFQNMIRVHMDHKSRAASCQAKVRRESGFVKGDSSFNIHAGTVDCCLQSIIVSIYAGKLSRVTHGFVPIGVDSITAWTSNPRNSEESAKVDTWVYEGSSRHFSANSQLISDKGELLLELQGVHCVPYEAAVPLLFQQRQQELPYWRMRWMPDLRLNRISKALTIFSKPKIGDIVTLLCHNNASTKVLDIGGHYAPEVMENNAFIDFTVSASSDEELQSKKDALKNPMSVKVVKLEFLGGILASSPDTVYDMIIASKPRSFQRQFLRTFSQLLLPHGLLLVAGSRCVEAFADSDLESSGFEFVDGKMEGLDVLTKSLVGGDVEPELRQLEQSEGRSLLLISRTSASPLSTSLLENYSQRGYSVRWSLLQEAQVQPNDQVIILPDFDQFLLLNLQENELKSLQNLARATTHIVWVTVGGLLSGRSPEHAMVSGLARSLRSESAALDLITIDFDTTSNTIEQMKETTMMLANRQIDVESVVDAENLVENGMIYVSRLAPIVGTNNACGPFLHHAKASVLEKNASLEAMVQSGKLRLQYRDDKLQSPEDSQAEVMISSLGTNEAGVFDIAGLSNHPASIYEIGGIVTAVGSGVVHLKVGDKVVGFSSDKFSTPQTTLAELLYPIEDKSSFETMLTLPTAFSTAIYGLNELAHLEEGETVLIFGNTGAAGLAAAQISRIAKAKFLIISENEDTYASLIRSGFTDNEIILCKDGNVSSEIHRRTEGTGADVVFSHKTADSVLLHNCTLSLAPSARLVLFGTHISHSYITDGLFDTSEFGVSTFDLPDLCHRKPKLAARLLRKCIQLYNDRMISNVAPAHLWGTSEADEVSAQISENLHAGKSVIFFDSHSIVRTIASQPSPNFDPNAVYLLVGCLGGLGRSLTFWLIDRGARHLAFMARSGSERPAAAELISNIRAREIEVTVLRGDVADKDDVDACVQTITQHRELRGVVNAAMVLHDGLFQSMDPTSWCETIDPKVKGSLNLHEATKALHLDFFVLTSSTSGILGTPGQSNYAAANAFQDALALHRKAIGLPAVSLILPMVLGVGHVADNPEIEDSLLRKGIYGIHEDELLAGFEAAMMPPRDTDSAIDHVILGFDPAKLASSVTQAETTDAFWLDDPRFSIITAMMKRMSLSSGMTVASTGSIVTDIRSAKSSEDAISSLVACLRRRLARLLSIDGDHTMPENRSVASYGLDSMIGTEFRSWVFKEFGTDIPYQKLLAPSLTIKGLALDLYEACCGKKLGKD